MHHSEARLIALLAALASLVGCAGATVRTQELASWGAPQGYQWVEGPTLVETPEQLSDRLGGAAQPIIDLGWRRSVFGALKHDDGGLSLTIHEMVDRPAAYHLFEQASFSEAQSVGIGERGLLRGGAASAQGVVFQKGPAYCEIMFEQKGSTGPLLELARDLAKRLP